MILFVLPTKRFILFSGIFAPLSKISKAGSNLLGSPHATSTPIKGLHHILNTPSPSRIDTSRISARVDTGEVLFNSHLLY